MMTVQINHRFYAAHFYKQAKWTPEKNKETFGLCYSQFGHGHNYKWEASFEVPNAAVDISQLEAATAALNEKLDHTHLNLEPHSSLGQPFTERIPTTENIALFLFEYLAKEGLPYPIKSLRLYEDDTIFADVVRD